MLSLFDKGIELFNSEININLIMKKVRRNRICINKLFDSKDINFEIKYDKKNIIDIAEDVVVQKPKSLWGVMVKKTQDP